MASQELSRPAPDTKNVRLVRARFNAGLTQAELAKRVGLSRQSVQALEDGARPRPGNAKAIADVLGVRASDIFDFDGGTDHTDRQAA